MWTKEAGPDFQSRPWLPRASYDTYVSFGAVAQSLGVRADSAEQPVTADFTGCLC